MRRKTKLTLILAAIVSIVVASTAFGSGVITIYSNKLMSNNSQAAMIKTAGNECIRGGSASAFRIRLGKRTAECAYRAPVVGRDLDISATARLLAGTPKKMQKRINLSLSLRTGDGGRYQLAVFPIQRKFQLRKILPNDTRKFLKVGKRVSAIRRVIGRSNALRLQAFVTKPGKCRVIVIINKKIVGKVKDDNCAPLKGRFPSISVGSSNIAKGAVGSFSDLRVRVPNPY